MAREYTIGGGNITVAGATSLCLLQPPSNTPIEILRMWISQAANNTSAQQRVQVFRQAAAQTTTATSVTPQALKEGDPASVLTGATTIAAGHCGINPSAEGAGTKTVLFDDAFNVLNGWLWIPTQPEIISCQASSANSFGFWFPVAPATLTGWEFGLNYREVT